MGAHQTDKIRDKISELTEISDVAWADMSPLFREKTLNKNAYFLRSGDEAVEIAFVLEGVLREYFSDAKGNEFNKSFIASGDFTGSLFDLLSEQPSIASIQALTPSTLLIADYTQFSALYDKHPSCERLGRLIAERLFSVKARREYEFLTKSAEDRYLDLLDLYPKLELLVPQYHIASYLGITDVALSRIRRRLQDPH